MWGGSVKLNNEIYLLMSLAWDTNLEPNISIWRKSRTIWTTVKYWRFTKRWIREMHRLGRKIMIIRNELTQSFLSLIDLRDCENMRRFLYFRNLIPRIFRHQDSNTSCIRHPHVIILTSELVRIWKDYRHPHHFMNFFFKFSLYNC